MTSARRVVITGSSGGIGEATAAVFRADGWTVVGVDRAPGGSRSACDVFVEVDLGDGEAAEEVLSAIAKEPVHALVNNAAMSVMRPLVDTSNDDWDAVMRINVRAAQQSMRILFPALSDARGAVVNVSSVHAVATSQEAAAYAASKGALCALTRVAALEFAASGVRVNAVLPGAVDTPMLRIGVQRRPAGQTEEEALEELAAKTPLGRIANPAEIAEVILFLADGRRSSFVTGQTLIADGGATARLSTE